MSTSNFLGKLNMKKNGRLFGIGTSPEADWRFVFVSALIIAILVICLSVFIFMQVDKGEVFINERPDGGGGRTLNTSALRETVSYYQAKGEEFERLRISPEPSVDPSL